MAYTNLQTTFVYKLLLTYQLMDQLAENDAMMIRTDLGGQTVTQSQADEWGLKIYRDKAEIGTYPLLLIEEDNAASTQPVLEIDNDGGGESIKFTHAVTRYLILSGYDLTSLLSDDSLGVLAGAFENTDGGWASKTWYGPVQLPHGAIISELRLFYIRTEGVMTTSLYRGPLDATGVGTIGTVTASDAGAVWTSEIEDAPLANNTVDNTAYYYYFRVTIDNVDNVLDQLFSGVRLTYTIQEPLP